jgi:hypothetical protein
MRIRSSLGEINLGRFILAWCYDYVHYVRSLTIHIHIGLSKNILCIEYILRTHAHTHAMKYSITNYTRKRAKQIGVVVKLSSNPVKKIDVFRKSRKIASVGAAGMNDFPTYIRTRGLAYAKTRRRLYKMRHERDRHTKWTNGWLADKLLW